MDIEGMVMYYRTTEPENLPNLEESKSTVYNQSDLDSAILYHSNQERRKQGAPDLKPDNKLAEMAKYHTDNMADQNFFSHDNPNGEKFDDRVSKYFTGSDLMNYSPSFSENLGVVDYQREVPPEKIDDVAKTLVKGWMDSPSHRKALLDKNYELVGIGSTTDGKKFYAAQNFN